jgi:hypothetical protein
MLHIHHRQRLDMVELVLGDRSCALRGIGSQ